MQLQILEADFIDQARDGIYSDYVETRLQSVRKTRLGVGLGEFDRWMGLWLWPEHPGEVTAMVNVSNYNSEFVPRDQLIHMFRRLRPGQVRGVTWFAPILTTARDLSDYIDACNVKAKAEACFAAFVTNDDSTGKIFDEQDEGIETLEPGTIKELRVGQDIKFAQPTSTSQAETILMLDLQAMAAGVGCTYDQVTGDLRQANYSSLRAGKMDFWRLINQLQRHVVIPKFCAPVRARFIDRAILAGRLPDRDYPCEWVVPAKEAIDPKKDLDAEIHEVRAGRVTPQQFIAARGNNWRRNIDEFETFFELAHEHKQTFDIDAGAVDQHGRQPPKPAATGGAGDSATAEDDATDAADKAAEDAAEEGSRVVPFLRSV
jgi:lambda family phage portal protein